MLTIAFLPRHLWEEKNVVLELHGKPIIIIQYGYNEAAHNPHTVSGSHNVLFLKEVPVDSCYQ